MKTRNPEIESLVGELIKQQNKAAVASKRVSEIKALLRSHMGSERLLEAKDHFVLIETRNRTDLNKDALMHDLGYETFKKYQVRSGYEIMTVKPLRKVG